MRRDTLTKQATIPNMDEMLQFISTRLQKLKVSDEELNYFVLAAEELIVNIISYGYKEKKPGNITLELEINEAENNVILRIIDDGMQFNILTVKPPNLNDTEHNLSKGGFGIHLVKSFTDKLEYEWKNMRNHAILHKKFTIKPQK